MAFSAPKDKFRKAALRCRVTGQDKHRTAERDKILFGSFSYKKKNSKGEVYGRQ
nr:hypothetical protein [uncultured Oscillibacter sp.]